MKINLIKIPIALKANKCAWLTVARTSSNIASNKKAYGWQPNEESENLFCSHLHANVFSSNLWRVVSDPSVWQEELKRTRFVVSPAMSCSMNGRLETVAPSLGITLGVLRMTSMHRGIRFLAFSDSGWTMQHLARPITYITSPANELTSSQTQNARRSHSCIAYL